MNEAARTRVSLVTVIYGETDLIGTCIGSAQESARHAGVELDVILIDNKPGDGTLEAALRVAPDAQTIENDENVGFAQACNQGFDVAGGDWWLLLNPDATLEPAALGELVDFGERMPGAGAVAPALFGAGLDKAESSGMRPGLRSAVGHFWLLNRLIPGDRGGPWRGLQLHRRLHLGPRLMDWASGGALLLRPEAVRAVGGFDPAFFLYADDVDLGTRMTDAGWQVWLVPAARAQHSVAATSVGGVTDRWFVSLHGLYAREASRVAVALFDTIAACGLTVRALSARDGLHRRRMAVAARAAFRLARGGS